MVAILMLWITHCNKCDDDDQDNEFFGFFHKSLFEDVKEVVNKHDPMGLLRMGAPGREYTPEIKPLCERLSYISPVEVKAVFDYWFYPGCLREEVVQALAADLKKVSLKHF